VSQYANLLLNKVIENNDVQALTRFNITEADMATAAERQAFRFITDYAEANRGQAPSYATVVAECADFMDVPQVTDSYEYLSEQIKDHTIKLALQEYISGAFTDKFNAGSKGKSLLDDLLSEGERIKMETNTCSSFGTDLKAEGQSFLDEYFKRKDGKSFKIWPSKFPSINEQIGGYMSGNMYTWYGRSGRGKSVFTMEEIVEAAFQGANVLVWSMEMSRFEWMARAYSSISAEVSGTVECIDGIDYEVGFENRLLLTGRLTEGYEQGLKEFIGKLNEIMDGNIILRAADDIDFVRRDVKQLEADIIAAKADVVLVDPIYLMDYEANTSKVAGGDVANTSKKIRRIAGYTNATIHIITQAEEVRDDTDENGNRELRPPKRAEIKKTKSVLEDATNTFGIDSLDGRGLIEIGKGRNGGEGTQVEVLYLPNYGIVKELPTGENVASQFVFLT
jgi:replicative DNA helicase